MTESAAFIDQLAEHIADELRRARQQAKDEYDDPSLSAKLRLMAKARVIQLEELAYYIEKRRPR